MVVDVGKLVPVQAGRGADDVGDIEPGDRLGVFEDLVVAVAPTEPGQIVTHGFRQVAELGELGDCLSAMALGELGAVRPVDHRQVGEGRQGPIQGAVDEALAGGVAEVIVAADDVGDPHVVVVSDDGEVVGRGAIRPQ